MKPHSVFFALLASVVLLSSCSDDESSPAPTSTPTRSATLAATPSATATRSATATHSAPPSATNTAPPSETRTAPPTPTPTAVDDQTITPTVLVPSTRCPLTPTGTRPPLGSPTPTFFGPTPHFVTHFEPTPPETVTDYWPRFAPDGATILFTRSLSAQAKSFLLTVPASGGEVEEFPPPGPARTPLPVSATRSSWPWNTSLEEHQIAFSGVDENGSYPSLISEDGSGLDEITLAGLGAVVDYPSWYPDGIRLAVVDYGAQGALSGTLRSIDTANQIQTQLTDPAKYYAGEPAVSRDGSRIAFPGQINCGYGYNQDDNEMYLLNLSTLSVSQFDAEQGRTPDWSPDDAFLAYETTRYCGNGAYAVIIQSVANRTAIQATDCAYDANHPVWSPDGQTLAFSGVIPGTVNRGIATIPVPELGAVRGYTVSGVLHSFECDGQASSDYEVHLIGADGQGTRVTDSAEGVFSFANVTPGIWHLFVNRQECGNAPCYDPPDVQVTDADVSVGVCFQNCPAPRLQPNFGPAGSTVEAFGRCYWIHSGGSADILFDGVKIGTTPNADTSGNWLTNVQIPLDAAPGMHTIALSVAPATTVPFEVTAPQ